jgi:hypothetical protein
MGIWAQVSLIQVKCILPVYSRYAALNSNTLTKIISVNDYNHEMPVFRNENSVNTWKFKASGVPDFTFGMSDYYLWDAKSVYDGAKNVFVSAVYHPESVQFYELCEAASRTVEMMSNELPGLPFPYPGMTVFNGGGGVESPMMVNMSSSRERIWMVHTTVHEVVHSLFPFHMVLMGRLPDR